jgi:hypothetical protein
LLVLNNARGNVGVRRECLAHSGCWLVKDRAQLPIPQGGLDLPRLFAPECVGLEPALRWRRRCKSTARVQVADLGLQGGAGL